LQPRNGEVSEWLKEHAWKVCIPQKGIEGSNPSLSASKQSKNKKRFERKFKALFVLFIIIYYKILWIRNIDTLRGGGQRNISLQSH
jgi:hypothetical protein